MDIFEAIEKRYSARHFEDRQIEQVKLDKIFGAARLAPSAKNLQEWRFVVARDKDSREQLAKAAYNQMFIANAPCVIACCAVNEEYIMKCGLPSYPIDVAIAVDHITLAATALGLGTCWIGKFDPDKVRSILCIPRDVEIVEILILGYPSDEAKTKSRLPLDEIVKYDRW